MMPKAGRPTKLVISVHWQIRCSQGIPAPTYLIKIILDTQLCGWVPSPPRVMTLWDLSYCDLLSLLLPVAELKPSASPLIKLAMKISLSHGCPLSQIFLSSGYLLAIG